MDCQNCGEALQEGDSFCSSCGSGQKQAARSGSGLVGFSSKINDPAFTRYTKHANLYALIFSGFLAAAAIIGFFIYGETSSEMDNPEALYIGMGIGGMFLAIALFQVIGRKRSKTWDGTVVDKQINQRRRRKRTGDGSYYWEDYLDFVVVIEDGRGKKHEISAEDDDTLYNYYRIGDRVRHHGGLNSYEKYNKSRDSIIFCSACASLCDINDDVCFRCKCPLLK
ncbi:MAG: zinc ribbon domain-containing protein [Firmicutes bacterium]|nr:zinc ribbon domain-containing protein [Bacillota bacterium]